MPLPTIGVVTPSFNQARFIEKTILSVIEQNYPGLQYYVFDGRSTDNTVEIIKRYETRLSGWVSRKDRGQSDAINQGFRAAKGDVLCWINSDDYLCPGSLAKVGAFFESHPEAQWVIGASEVFFDGAPPHEIHSSPLPVTKAGLMAWWPSHWFCQQSVFWRRTLLERVGYLDVSLHYLMDWDLWLRFYSVATPFSLQDVLAGYRLHRDAKCLRATNQLRLEELLVHQKIQAANDGELLSCYKGESANRLIELVRNYTTEPCLSRRLSTRELLNEFLKRLRDRCLRVFRLSA